MAHGRSVKKTDVVRGLSEESENRQDTSRSQLEQYAIPGYRAQES